MSKQEALIRTRAAKDPVASPKSPAAKTLPPAAERALQEAAARRAAAEAAPAQPAREINGRGGLDPVRYGDWEVKGIAVDF